jgi:mitogen-activated protein kinase kinase kinase 19
VFCNYTKQILEGVEYLHRNNIIHRDIKGGNIMLMPDGVIKLIDFGCAKKLCLNLTTAGSPSPGLLLRSMRGTPYWMAPEVVNEEGHGTKSDIWSIGCTVFEMATKNPPWADMPPTAAIFCIGSDTKPIPQLPDKFSSLARSFVGACLTRDPSLRPSATQMLLHAFIVMRRRTAKTSRRS